MPLDLAADRLFDARYVLEQAIALAPDAMLRLLHVVDPRHVSLGGSSLGTEPVDLQEVDEACRNQLRRLAEDVVRDDARTECRVAYGDLVSTIRRQATDCQLVLMTQRPVSRFGRLVSTRLPERVVDDCPAPVVTIIADEDAAAPLDGVAVPTSRPTPPPAA
ncbi:MAG: universal stress protein [Polyangiaceae bacterium]